MAELIKLAIQNQITLIPQKLIQNKYSINNIGQQYEKVRKHKENTRKNRKTNG